MTWYIATTKKLRTLVDGAALVFPFWVGLVHWLELPLWWVLPFAGIGIVMQLRQQPRIVRHLLLLACLAIAMACLGTRPENTIRIYPFLIAAAAFMSFLASWRVDGNILVKHAAAFVTVTPEVREFLARILPLWVVGIGLNAAVLFVLVFAFPLQYWLWYTCLWSYVWLGFLGAVTFIWAAIEKLHN